MSKKLREILEQLKADADFAEGLTDSDIDNAEAAIKAWVRDEIIGAEYEADYDKYAPCPVCGDPQYSHGPDSHMEYGAEQLREIQRSKL